MDGEAVEGMDGEMEGEEGMDGDMDADMDGEMEGEEEVKEGEADQLDMPEDGKSEAAQSAQQDFIKDPSK